MCVSLLIRNLGLCFVCVLAVQGWAQNPTPRLQSETTMDNSETRAPLSGFVTEPNHLGSPLTLQPSTSLDPKPGPTLRRQMPTYLRAQSLSGRSDVDVQLQGEVELRRGDTLLRANSIDYDQARDWAKASGDVYINRAGTRYLGTELEIRLDAMEGYLLDPTVLFLRGNGQAKAQKLTLLNDKQAIATQARFTTCKRKPGPEWLPDWFMAAERMDLDQDTNLGVATHGRLVFQGVPILYAPRFGFPLNNERQSGFLPPTFAINSIGGLEMSLPYYWNIAPNRDMTLTTTPMTQRGLLFSNEFRYLERKEPQPPFRGQARLDLMPIDELRQSSRWGLSYQHTGLPDARRPVAFNLNLNRVSDSHYWEDFTTNPSDPLVQRSLLNSGSVAWGMGQFGTSIVVNQWQTQQGTTASTAIAPAYDRLPQINVNYLRADMAGFDWQLNTELTRFSVNRNFYCSFYTNSAYCNQPTGARIVLNQQITRPFVNAFGHVTPKWMFNARQYQYENAYRGIDGSSSPVDSNAVNVPTFSLDAGMVLERSMAWSDQRWLQTLEPRAFYVKTPYRNQSDLPNFDTGLNDYNFASIFSENTFSGQDRVSDSHTLTLGVSTRFIQPDSGAEGARLGLAQRYRLSDQNVQLTPQTAVMKSGNSDILAGASLYVTPRLTLDSLIDYSDQEQRLERSSVGARYNPSAYRVINTAYRYQRASSEVVDLSWQWPVNDLWRDLGVDRQQGQGLGGGRLYSIGRLNFNLLDNRLVDSMLGLEYDGGCWVSRFALQRTQLTLSTSTTSLMFQLEFNDFSRLGVGNVGLARDNISRYQNLREPFKFSPSPFAAYD